MISRSEIDLLNIRGEFIDLFDKSLYHMIEVKGDGHPTWLSTFFGQAISWGSGGREH